MSSSFQQSRPTRLARAWPLHRISAAAVLLHTLLSARASYADCGVPPPSVEFTYPDETTESVPPDAVFWVVSPAGEARAWIDGVPLAQRETSGAGRHQFVYPTALADGEHELVAQAGNDSRRTVTFQVAARPPSTGTASIDSVDIYPLARGPSGWLDPPGYDAECARLAAPLGTECNDTLDWSYAHVEYSGEGDVVAYLLQGGWIVPAQCTAFLVDTWSYDPSSFRISAVLPTGVTEARTFAGTVDVHSTREAYPELFYDGPDACSLGLGRRAPSAVAGVGLALVAWLMRRRRSAERSAGP